MQSAKTVGPEPSFLPLVEACRIHGIGRSKAFELAAAGIIETFLIGSKRYALLDSLRSLPQRLTNHTGDAQ